MTASKIEWTDRSDWNPVRGCTRVSRGCGGPGDQGGCYAEGMAARFSLSAAEVEARWRANPKNAGKVPPVFKDQWGHGFAEMRAGRPRWTGAVTLLEDRLLIPLGWPKTPAKVFPNSTSDFFHEDLPDEDIDRLFAVMALCPHVTFQIPTKRAERMRRYFAGIPEMPDCPAARDAMIEGAAQKIYSELHPDEDRDAIGMQLAVHMPLPNVWLGVSVEDQATADERIPDLIATPAAVRFISAEPLLGPIDLTSLRNHIDLGEGQRWLNALGSHGAGYVYEGADTCSVPRLDWVIAGGESGRGARPMNPAWPRQLRDQCEVAAVPFFFKQWGEWQSGMPAASGVSGKFAIWHEPIGRLDGWTYRDVSPRYIDRFGATAFMTRVGKSKSGRLLDGREHNEFPKTGG